MEIKLYDIKENNNGMPILEIEKKINYKVNGKFSDPTDTIKALCQLTEMEKKYTESFYIAVYDIFRQLIGFFHIASGGRNQVQYSKKIIATAIILTGASYFKAFHNHQINGCEASEADIMSLYDLKHLGDVLETECTGSFIITRDSFCEISDSSKDILYELGLK